MRAVRGPEVELAGTRRVPTLDKIQNAYGPRYVLATLSIF